MCRKHSLSLAPRVPLGPTSALAPRGALSSAGKGLLSGWAGMGLLCPLPARHRHCLLPGPPEGRDSSAPSGAPAGSPLDRTEPGFLADPEPSAQEAPDGPLEPWGWDVGCPSLTFRDEVDSIFPDFFPC